MSSQGNAQVPPAKPPLELPRLVFRVGFAGTQKLPQQLEELSSQLELIFKVIATCLAGVAGRLAPRHPVGRVAKFYEKEHPPLLRLITGLCQGADALADLTLQTLVKKDELAAHVCAELAAVLPFDLATYRKSRPPEYQASFDEQIERCSYVVVADGIYDKDDTALAITRRARGYRAQGALLLRQADLLIALADPELQNKPGGTMETVRAALAFDLPVVFLHTRTAKITIIEPGEDPVSAFSELEQGREGWAVDLDRRVTQLTADPDSDEENSGVDLDYGSALLREFFDLPAKGHESRPPKSPFSKWLTGETLWGALTERCRPRGLKAKSDPLLDPYSKWRKRSTTLNYSYSGHYRGTFLLNYVLAAAAVALAAFSIVLLGKAEPGHLPEHYAHCLHCLLFFLGVLKALVIGLILYNTHRATHGDWNDRAVDYRYLAERLRAMLYLPRIGSFQPPGAAAPQHATQAVRQSAVDWLLGAIIRAVSPAAVAEPHVGDGKAPPPSKLRTLDPLAALHIVRDSWIWEQSVYHDGSARTMDRVHQFAESCGKACNKLVLGCVVVDVVITIAVLSIGHNSPEFLHPVTLLLMFCAALLPAVVASLNGVRFQSECQRLAERSAVMRTILRGREPATPATPQTPSDFQAWHKIFLRWPQNSRPELPRAQRGGRWADADRLATKIANAKADKSTDPGGWTTEVLYLTETVADVFAQEVVEWSVLYAKELPEP